LANYENVKLNIQTNDQSYHADGRLIVDFNWVGFVAKKAISVNSIDNKLEIENIAVYLSSGSILNQYYQYMATGAQIQSSLNYAALK